MTAFWITSLNVVITFQVVAKVASCGVAMKRMARIRVLRDEHSVVYVNIMAISMALF